MGFYWNFWLRCGTTLKVALSVVRLNSLWKLWVTVLFGFFELGKILDKFQSQAFATYVTQHQSPSHLVTYLSLGFEKTLPTSENGSGTSRTLLTEFFSRKLLSKTWKLPKTRIDEKNPLVYLLSIKLIASTVRNYRQKTFCSRSIGNQVQTVVDFTFILCT